MHPIKDPNDMRIDDANDHRKDLINLVVSVDQGEFILSLTLDHHRLVMMRGHRSSSSASPAWRRLDAILLLVWVCCQTSVSAFSASLLTLQTTSVARYVDGAVSGW